MLSRRVFLGTTSLAVTATIPYSAIKTTESCAKKLPKLDFESVPSEATRADVELQNDPCAFPDYLSLYPFSRGFTVRSFNDKDAFIDLYFYEWNLFDAVLKGEETGGSEPLVWQVAGQENKALTIDTKTISGRASVAKDGVDINLSITNRSDHDWPFAAAIVPCLGADNRHMGNLSNPYFFDDHRERTYFLGKDGLTLLKAREMHFNHDLRHDLDEISEDRAGRFSSFSGKWPTSQDNAYGGLMVRESVDQKWVVGIAWDRYLGAQGHNPRRCMHLSVTVGSLSVGQKRNLRGKIYLFKGSRQECLDRYRREINV